MSAPLTRLRPLVVAVAALTTWSASAQDNKPVFEEVIVTAEKRGESLQDLSQAVTALSGEDLDNRNITSFVDLSSIAPGVTIAKNEGFKTVITIRGVGNEANQNAIANPSVSYHLDGIYVASPYALQTDFLDLERIEVLRGPQGTLFGQNSTGGAVNVITAAPDTEEFFGTADLTLGSYNLRKARAMFNIPMGDTVAMRASVSATKRDGFTDNLTLGQELDDSDSISARVRMLWEATPNLRFHLTGQYFDEEVNGAAQKGLHDDTSDARELRQDSSAEYALESQLYSLVAEWDFDTFSIKSLTSYQDDDILIQRDNDRTDLAALPPFTVLPSVFAPETNRQKTFTQEINLISAEPLWGKIDWVAGVFYLDTEVDIHIREYLDFGFDGTFDPVTEEMVLNYEQGDYGFLSDSKPERDSTSVYAQGTYHFTDEFRVIGGLRYSEDEVYSEVTNFFGRAGTDILEIEGDKVTGRVAAEYDLSDSTMVYASYTHGYKPGGSNLTYGLEDVIAPIVVLPTFEDEEVDAFEVGIKTDLADGLVRVNAAAFFYDYENLQYQATDPEVFQGGVGNIPESEIYGAELEVLAFLHEKVTLDARLSWLETEITANHLALDNVNSEARTNELLAQGFDLFGPEIQQARAEEILEVRGNELAKTPGFSADITLRYVEEIADWGNFEGSAQYTYRSDFEHRIFNNPTSDNVPSYDIINLVATFYPHDQPWRVDLMAMNITDEDGINARFTDVFGVGSTSDELIAPRQYMARFTYDF